MKGGGGEGAWRCGVLRGRFCAFKGAALCMGLHSAGEFE